MDINDLPELHQSEETPPKAASGKSLRPNALWRLVSFIFRISRQVIITLLGIYLLLQLPPVQKELRDAVTNYLSKAWQMDVQAERLYVDYFNVAVLQNFLVLDRQQDTLLHTGLLRVEFGLNPFDIYRGVIKIRSATLDGGHFALRRPAGSPDFNLQPILDWLQPSKGSQNKKQPDLRIRQINVKRFLFERNDLLRGQLLAIDVPTLSVTFNHVDLTHRFLGIELVDVAGLHLRLSVIEGDRGAVDEQDLLAFLAPDSTATTLQKLPDLSIKRLRINQTRFELNNYVKEDARKIPDTLMDYHRLLVDDIRIEADSIRLAEAQITGQLKHLSAREQSGFTLTRAQAQQVSVSDNKLMLAGLNLETPYSRLGDTLIFKYGQFSDFIDFPNAVALDLRFKNSTVRLRDVMFFAHQLPRNRFFSQNQRTALELSGRVFGKINSLNGRDIQLRAANDTYARANFSTHELTNSDMTALDIQFDRLVSSISTLRSLLPGFDPPDFLYKLGKFDMTRGSITGFYHDMVISGKVSTDIGMAYLSTRFDFKTGKNDVKLNGKMDLTDFKLGYLLNTDKIGTVSVKAAVTDGHIRSQEGFEGNLTLDAQTITALGYTYHNIHFGGRLAKNILDGKLLLDDPNARLVFNGKLNLGTDRQYQFEAQVEKLNLPVLGFSTLPYSIQGDIKADVVGAQLRDLGGRIEAGNLKLIKSDNSAFRLARFNLSMLPAAGVGKRLKFHSDLGWFDAQGDFRIDQLVFAFNNYMYRHFPVYARDIGFKGDISLNEPYDFSFKGLLTDPSGSMGFFLPQLQQFNNLKLDGIVRSGGPIEVMQILIGIDTAVYKNYRIQDVLVRLDADCDNAEYSFIVDRTTLPDKSQLARVAFEGHIDATELTFNLQSKDTYRDIAHIDIHARLRPEGKFYRLEFKDSETVLFNESWTVAEGNTMYISRDSIRTNNFFVSSSGNRVISLKSRDAVGLELVVKHLNLEVLSLLVPNMPIDISGDFDLKATTRNIFKLSDITGYIYAEDVMAEGMHLGTLEGHLDASDPISPYEALITLIDKNKSSVKADLTLYPKKLDPEFAQVLGKQPGSLYLNIEATTIPMEWLQLLIPTGISDVQGVASGRLDITGLPDNLDFRGKAKIKNGAVTIDYTKTTYRFESADVRITNTAISADGQYFTDRFGRKATIRGGLTHNRFKNFGLDCTIETDGIQALNTGPKDNNLFYGQAVAAGVVQFSGDFVKPNMNIVARSLPGTFIKMPFEDEKRTGQNNFIKFVNSAAPADTMSVVATKSEGLNIDMTLDVTDDAEIWLIFDQRAGDIVKGTGAGNLRMTYNRTGEFSMNGRYTISRGEYLFTLLNFVNKPFIVKPGGTISWAGDPMAAQIRLDAEYRGASAPLYNFIEEFLNTPEEQQLAQQPVPVELGLHMEGALFKPDITFTLDFPNLAGNMRSYADSKLRTIKQDPNELNRQVFGLIVVGSFLPSTQAFAGGGVGAVNTVSEMLTNQLSMLLTGFLSQYTGGLNVNIDYNRYQVNQTNAINIGDEFRVRVRKDNLLNNRVSITGGASVDNGPFSAGNGAFWGGDILVELFITPDRRLKLTAYNTTSRDQFDQFGRRNRTGVGIAYSKEFDNLQELIRQMPKI